MVFREPLALNLVLLVLEVGHLDGGVLVEADLGGIAPAIAHMSPVLPVLGLRGAAAVILMRAMGREYRVRDRQDLGHVIHTRLCYRIWQGRGSGPAIPSDSRAGMADLGAEGGAPRR